jgi:hypothetical protein
VVAELDAYTPTVATCKGGQVKAWEPRRYRTARTPGIDRSNALNVQLSPSATLNTMTAFDVAGIDEPKSTYCVHTTKG